MGTTTKARRTQQISGRLEPATLVSLILATFVVALGYGTLLPLLPEIVRRIADGPTEPTDVARDISLLTSIFAAAPIFMAYAWGALSDRFGRRPVLILGLTGFALTFVLSGLPSSLSLLYLVRFLNGSFGAAVIPSVLSLITDVEIEDGRRARAFGWISAAGSLGLLAGPLLGGFAAGWTSTTIPATAGLPIAFPFAAVSVLALATIVAIALTAPTAPPMLPAQARLATESSVGLRVLLILLGAVSAMGLGFFEVGLTLRAQVNSMSPAMLGTLFGGCMVVMIAVQVVAFSPWSSPRVTRWLAAPSFALLGAGLILIPLSGSNVGLEAAMVAVAAGGGFLTPSIGYWLSHDARGRAGASLGLQSSTSALGQTIGSASAALLFYDVRIVVAAIATIATAAALGALALSARLTAQEAWRTALARAPVAIDAHQSAAREP